MKKLISLLLVLTLALSLMSGVSVSAFASDEVAGTTDEASALAADGEGTTPPDGDGTTPPDGDGTTPPGGDGTTPPDGDGTTPPDGDGTTPPDGDGTTPPDGDGTTPPDGDGTTPPDGDGTTPPDGDGTTPPDGDGTTPPDGDGTTPPDSDGTTPPDGDGTTPPDGDGTTPPDGDGTTPPDGDGTTPPDGDGTTPPDGDGTTPPDGDGTTPPPADGGSWTKAEGLVDGQEYVIAVENGDGTLSVLKNDNGNVAVATIASASEATAEMLWTATSASRGYLIQNGETCLYYKDSSGTYATTDTSKANWTYNGNLFYVGSGESYVVIRDGAMSIATTEADASAIVLFTTGSAGVGAPEGDPEGDSNTDPTPPPSEDGTWAEDTALTAGKTYVIGIKNEDGTISVLKDDGGKVVMAPIDSIDKADESMQWLAASGASGVSLQNVASTTDFLYYGEGMIRGSAASNWSYESGIMKYDRAGTAYYATITADAASAGTDSAAASSNVVIWSIGESSDDSNTDNGGTTTDSGAFIETNQLGAYPYIIIVDAASATAIGMDMGNYLTGTVTIAGEAPNRTATVSKGLCAGVTPGANGFAITLQDPPGSENFVCVIDGALSRSSTGTAEEFANWNLDVHGHLGYTVDGVTYYFKDITGAITTDESEALPVTIFGGNEYVGGAGGPPPGGEAEADEEAPVIVKQPDAIPFVYEGSGYAAPTLTIAAQLADGVTANNFYFQWYVDGEPVGEQQKIAVNADNSPVETSITLDSLKDQPVGVYNIYCEVTCNIRDEETGEPVPHTATSTNVAFTVCKGVLNNSFLTFSDVHETFANVGGAINDCITVNNGLVPALIICTGDWANAYYAGGAEGSENYEATMSQYIAKLYAQVSGIDIVFLAGNHDNTAAAADATIDAGLGAADDYDGAGLMYDSTAPTNGTSAKNTGLVVFGISYENLQLADGTISYENILPELEAFLKELEADYKGELVVISSHTGLHQLADWAGDGNYNVPKSDEMVALLNRYADTMDIMFFFGHDHSKGEAELFYKAGDPITSTVSFTDKTTETQTLGFSYGHAGYITNSIGGQERYSLVTWDGDTITRSMSVVNGNEIAELTYELSRVAEQPNKPDKPDITPDAPDTDPKPDKPKPDKDPERAPKTGDDANIILWIAVLVLCAGSLAILPRKKNN